MYNMDAVPSISEFDLNIISKQLGREPRGLRRVASRCVFGCPEVIEAKPFFEDGKPFPTLYWLTCPAKVKAVSRLEDKGWSDRFRKLLAADELFYKRFYAAQQDYISRRRTGSEKTGHPIFKTGVGGVKELEAIKCLHAHYAHYLATGTNPIGEVINREIAGIECKERCDTR